MSLEILGNIRATHAQPQQKPRTLNMYSYFETPFETNVYVRFNGTIITPTTNDAPHTTPVSQRSRPPH